MTAIRKRIVIASLVFALGVIGVSAWRVLDNREVTIERTKMIASGARDAAVANVRQLFRGLDLSLKGVQRGLWLLEGQTLDEATQRKLLFDNSIDNDSYGSTFVINKDGFAVFDLRGSNELSPLSRREKEPFRVHVTNPDYGLYIGKPSVGTQPGEVPVTRRLTNRAGEFFGVAAGHIPLKVLQAMLTNRQIPGINLSILFDDGSHLIRVAEAQPLDHPPSSSRTMARFARTQSDTFLDRGVSDGRLRVVSYSHMDGYPLIIRASVDADQALAVWRSQSLFFGAIVLMLVAVQLGLTRQLWKQLNLREDARHEEALLAEEMADMANTDQLTCLTNRRGFEGALDAECRRATREERPISVLLIDVDHFGELNDMLGKRSGDAALIDIADCLRACMRRGGDLAARLGGDEFAIILPNVDEHGARIVAELVRKSIIEKDLQFGEDRIVTISIGIAHGAGAQAHPGTLIEAARRALTRAKERGRNRVDVEPVKASA